MHAIEQEPEQFLRILLPVAAELSGDPGNGAFKVTWRDYATVFVQQPPVTPRKVMRPQRGFAVKLA